MVSGCFSIFFVSIRYFFDLDEYVGHASQNWVPFSLFYKFPLFVIVILIFLETREHSELCKNGRRG